MARKSAGTTAPDDLTPDQKRAVWKLSQRRFPWIDRRTMANQLEDMLIQYRAEGRTYTDWGGAFWTYLKNEVAWKRLKAPADTLGSSPPPPESEFERWSRRERVANLRAAEKAHREATSLEIAGVIEERKRKGIGV